MPAVILSPPNLFSVYSHAALIKSVPPTRNRLHKQKKLGFCAASVLESTRLMQALARPTTAGGTLSVDDRSHCFKVMRGDATDIFCRRGWREAAKPARSSPDGFFIET